VHSQFRPAIKLAQIPELKDKTHFIDVGGGSGIYTIQAVSKHPNMKGSILELGEVATIAAKNVSLYKLDNRVSVQKLNMFTEEFPKGDAILFANIFHDFDDVLCGKLLEKANRALPQDGIVIISERLFSGYMSGPLAVSLHNLDMLCWGTGRQFNSAELNIMVYKYGFKPVSCEKISGYFSAFVAQKVR